MSDDILEDDLFTGLCHEVRWFRNMLTDFENQLSCHILYYEKHRYEVFLCLIVAK